MKNKQYIYKTLFLCFMAAIITGCKETHSFRVKGVVAGAAGHILYLENTGLSSTILLDSVKLKPDGKFSFKRPRPQYPDFYRLRINNEIIHFSVDSTETITFTADAHTFETSYTVEGSENSKSFKEIRLAQLDANQEIQHLRSSYGMNLIPDTVYQASILNAVKSYKDIANRYIYGAPRSPAAYFALFQQIDGMLLYDLYDSADSKAFGAVATSYKTFYPESPRASQLESLALQSLKVTRSERLRTLELENAVEVSYIDIELPDVNEKNIKLSDIAAGKTVLVVFTAFQTEWALSLNTELNALFQQFNDKGFEIYQVSLDSDVHFWKNAAFNLPWITVHDPQTIYSSIAAIYNIRALPALFLIDKKGNLVKRIDSLETLEGDIQAAI